MQVTIVSSTALPSRFLRHPPPTHSSPITNPHFQLTAGKFLIKSLRNVLAGNRVSGPCEYMLAAGRAAFSRDRLVSDSELSQATSLTPDTVGMCSTFVASVALLLLLDAHDDALLAERDGLKGEAVWNRVAVQLVDAVKVGREQQLESI